MRVTAFIRQKDASKNDLTARASVYFRVRDVGLDIKCASELQINPNHWSQERQGYKTRVALVDDTVRLRFDEQVRELTNVISKEYFIGAKSDWLQKVIFAYHHPNAYKLADGTLVETKLTEWAEKYLKSKKFDAHQECNTKGLIMKISRFETFQQKVNKRKGYTMNIDRMTADDLRDFQDYLLKEHLHAAKYPELYEDFTDKSMGRQRSLNTVSSNMTLLRTVCNWVRKQGATRNEPFANYEMPKTLYGTPYYLTIEERDKVYAVDLSDRPDLAEYRDMFIFQCMVGCRHGDLVTFTPENIINGVLEYIPIKTINKVARNVRVSLTDKAQAIFEKHNHGAGLPLFPMHFNFKFNDAIREIMKRAEINRMVTVLNPLTREEEKRPLYEVATSHMARRTFIGNLYKQVKDPNLVASMSGHANGSQAFSRYRAIDDDMKRDLVGLIQ